MMSFKSIQDPRVQRAGSLLLGGEGACRRERWPGEAQEAGGRLGQVSALTGTEDESCTWAWAAGNGVPSHFLSSSSTFRSQRLTIRGSVRGEGLSQGETPL